MRRSRTALVAAGALLLGAFLGAAIVLVVPGPVVPLQDARVTGVPLSDVAVGVRDDPHRHIVVAPVDGQSETLFVLYPGAFLRPHTYTWIGVALAPHGVRTVIPAMPLDLAVLAPGRATALIEANDDVTRVVIGGHSLGGAMAARFADANPDLVDALVLLGAYTAADDDLNDADLEVLVLAGEHDGIATLEEVRKGMTRMPGDAELYVVPGAVHGFFGRYGPQRLDGTPTVARAEAEAAIIARLTDFVAAE